MRSSLLLTMLTMLISFGTAGAATIQATSFSTTHAGTTADPWPGSAIQSAIASAQGGDVVVVADGIWSFTSALGNTNDGFTLKGQSLNAKLVFSGSGSYSLGSSSALSHDIKISSLTFDGSQISSWTNPVSIYNCVDCSFTGNTVLGTANTSLAALIFYGGAGNKIASNSIIAGSSASGGAQLQINPLASSMAIPINSGYDVDGNYFDSVNLLVIGISNLHVHGNTIVNKTLGNYVALFFTSQYGGITPPTRNITIDNNTLDGGSSNSVAITGLPQDPGGQGAIDGLVISGNVLRGTGVDLAINSYVDSCFTTCTSITQTFDAVVVNNNLWSYWTGSKIDLRGGTYGVVSNVTVQGNILNGVTSVGPNVIQTDANTTNLNKANNFPAGL